MAKKKQTREGELLLTSSRADPVDSTVVTDSPVPEISGASLLSALGTQEASTLDTEFQQRLQTFAQPPDPTAEDILRAPVTPAEAGGDRRAAQFNSLMDTPALERLSQQTLFPSSTLGFRQSSTSLPGFGQVNIFSGTPIMPFAVINARAKAKQEAAAKRQKKIDELKSIFPELEETAPQLERRYSDFAVGSIDGLFDKATKAHKGNATAALSSLNDPRSPWFKERQQMVGTLNAIASEGLEMDKRADAVIKMNLDKDKFVPPKILDQALKFKAGMFDFDKFAEDPNLFRETTEQLRAYGNMFDAVNTQVMPNLELSIDNIIDEMTGSEIDVMMSTDDYSVITNIVRKHLDPKIANSLAINLKSSSDLFQPVDEISDLILKLAGDNIKKNPKIVTKYSGRGKEAEASALIRKEEVVVVQNPTFETVEQSKKFMRGGRTSNGEKIIESRLIVSGDNPGWLLMGAKGFRERVSFNDFITFNDVANSVGDRKNVDNQDLSKVMSAREFTGEPIDISQHMNPMIDGIQSGNTEVMQKIVNTSPDITGIKFEEAKTEDTPNTIIFTTNVVKPDGFSRMSRKILNDGSPEARIKIQEALAEFGVEDKVITNLARRGEAAREVEGNREFVGPPNPADQGGNPPPDGVLQREQDGFLFQWNPQVGDYEQVEQ